MRVSVGQATTLDCSSAYVTRGMPSFADARRALNQMKARGIVDDYQAQG